MKRLLMHITSLLFSIQIISAQDFTENKDREFLTISLEDLLTTKVVTASKLEQNIGNAPANIIVISEDQIKLRGYQSLFDVLIDLPDFKNTSNKTGGNTHFSVRGVAGQDKFIIMLDGVRISSPTNENVPIMSNYPVNFASQIEVVYGPASALYGADAVSGVINIITKKEDSAKLLAKATSMLGMYGLTNNSAFLSKKILEGMFVAIGGQYMYDQQPDLSEVFPANPQLTIQSYQTGTLNTFFGPMTSNYAIRPKYETPLKAYNIYGTIRFRDFSLAAFCNYAQVSTSTLYNTSNAVYNKEAFLGRYVKMLTGSYVKSIDNFKFTTMLMGSSLSCNPASNYRNLYSNLDPAYKYEYGSLFKVDQQVNYTILDNINIIGGFTYELFNSLPVSGDLESPVDTKAEITGIFLGSRSYYKPEGIAAKFYHLTYTNIGVYAQSQYVPNEYVSLTIGARYDKNSRFQPTFNPRIGVVINPSKKTTLKLLYNSAFLAPSPNSAYQYYGKISIIDSGRSYEFNNWHLPNPNLQPIKSKNIEVNLRQFITHNFSVSLSSYVTFLSDLLRLGLDKDNGNSYNGYFLGYKADNIEVQINQGKQVNYGGTIQLNHVFNFSKFKLQSYFSLSYVDGRVEYMKSNKNMVVDIDNISPVMLRYGLELLHEKFSISARMLHVGKQRISAFVDDVNPGARHTLNGYQLLNISARYRLLKLLSVFVNIDNALNQSATTIADGVNLGTSPSPFYSGNPQNPVRLMGGLTFNW